MKINSIDHRLLDFDDGLPPIHLQGLQRVVVLAGPNGAGKTRLIHRIERCGEESRGFMGKADMPMAWLRDLQKRAVIRKVRELNNEFDTATAPRIGVDFDPKPAYTETGDVVSFTFVDVSLPMLSSISLADIERAKGVSIRGGAAQITELTLHYIYAVQAVWWDATHDATTLDENTQKAAVARYESLQSIISQLIGAKLGRDSGHPTLFGSSISELGLSHGQIILLRWAVALHAHGSDPGEAIITMDEPENHLHPEGMIQAISRLIDVNTNGQVWIATHSVPLLAALFSRYPNDVSLYCLRDGLPMYSGRGPEQILLSLMGGEDNIAALRQFIDLPEMLAMNRFGAECLLPPMVVSEARESDPQIAVAQSTIGAIERVTVKVLDYGAGHGRLLDGLRALCDGRIAEQIDYVAWDVCSEPSQKCVAAIEAAYGSLGTRWHCERNELFRHHQPASFQVAVMCNVFHEIDPSDWISLFESNGVLSRALHADGRLVIIEDYLMPRGEYAHPFGFTLLDTEAIKVLFQAGAGKDTVTVIDAGGMYAGRIKAHVVPAHLLSKVSVTSRKRSLELSASNAEEQLKRLRTAGAGYRAGQAHAFWVQQFANCTIAIRNL